MKTEKASNIIPFTTMRGIQKDEAMIISHGPRTMEIVEVISDYIKGLPLSTLQNDTLVRLLKDQLFVAEHEAYIQGFMVCMEEIQSGGISEAVNKLIKSDDMEI